MKKWIKTLTSFLLLWVAILAQAQDIPLEAWRTHFSYNNVQQIIEGNGKIFCAVDHGLFYVDQSDKSLGILTKLDGLSDAGVTALAYSEDYKTLVIGYESGLIDLFTGGKAYTIFDLYRSSLVGSKRVNDIVTNGNKAYAGCSFGVLEISLDTRNLTDNYRSIGPEGTSANVLDLIISGNSLFAITERGIQKGALNRNLPDFNDWQYDQNDSVSFRNLTAYNDEMYVIANDTTLATYVNDSWKLVTTHNKQLIKMIASGPDGLYALGENDLWKYENNSLAAVEHFHKNEYNTIYHSDGFWLGTAKKGLIDPKGEQLLPNGPVTDEIVKLRYTNQNIYALYGFWPEYYVGQADSLGYSLFDNSQWKYTEIPGFYNISDIASFNGDLYFSSIGFGLYSSNLSDTVPGLGRTRNNHPAVIPQMAVDDRLYLTLWNHTNALTTMDKSSELTNYSAIYMGTHYPQAITISKSGTAWITQSEIDGGGIITVYLDEQKYRHLSGTDGLPSTNITDVQIDLSDAAWVATVDGPSVFADATFIFGNYNGSQPIYDNTRLFVHERINNIAVDGGNRIWFSNADGLWVFDNTLNSLITKYTTENSPLPSHNIKDMTFNAKNGEMYILTDKGLVSLRTNSSAGKRVQSNINIFPNPVRPDFTGLVGISGLVTNANVKITDINGKLVREVHANGGTASWDLLDYNMKRVASGVYVVFTSSADGTQTYIGKIAVIN